MRTLTDINFEISETVKKLNSLRKEKESLVTKQLSNLKIFQFKNEKIVSYRGKNYKLEFIGPTQHGPRAKLVSLWNTFDFWVDAVDVEEQIKNEPYLPKQSKEIESVIKRSLKNLSDSEFQQLVDEYLFKNSDRKHNSPYDPEFNWDDFTK